MATLAERQSGQGRARGQRGGVVRASAVRIEDVSWATLIRTQVTVGRERTGDGHLYFMQRLLDRRVYMLVYLYSATDYRSAAMRVKHMAVTTPPLALGRV